MATAARDESAGAPPITTNRTSGKGRWIAGTWTRNQFREIRRLLEVGHLTEALDLVIRIDESLK